MALDAHGDILRDSGRMDEALDAYTEAVRAAPRLPDPRLGLALVYRSRQQWSAAYEAMRDAIAFDPGLLKRWEPDLRELRAKATLAGESKLMAPVADGR